MITKTLTQRQVWDTILQICLVADCSLWEMDQRDMGKKMTLIM